MAWSRWRFVRLARDQRRQTTLALLSECLEALNGVPRVVLADRMACLKTGVVANVVVPYPDYVRLVTHYGFGPDFCDPADPESKGVVEALVGYAKTDLLIPAAAGWASLTEANTAAQAWCEEVNIRVHSETNAVPAERPTIERGVLRALPNLPPPLRGGQLRGVDRPATVRFGPLLDLGAAGLAHPPGPSRVAARPCMTAESWSTPCCTGCGPAAPGGCCRMTSRPGRWSNTGRQFFQGRLVIVVCRSDERPCPERFRRPQPAGICQRTDSESTR